MNQAKVVETKSGWMVLVNGEMYGEYKTPSEAQEIARSFRGTLAN